MEQGDTWGIVHPVTNQEMVGTWVTLSSASISSSLSLDKGYE